MPIERAIRGERYVWHEFLDPPETVFSTEDGPVAFQSDIGGTWLEANGGVTAQVSDSGTVFLDAAYIWDTEDLGHAISGRVGVRFNW